MRRLFIVGVKLIGIICIWLAISTTIQYITSFSYYEVSLQNRYQILTLPLQITALLAYFVLSICFALILLFRTDWVCRKVGMEQEEKLVNWPEQNTLLYLGIVLIGIYLLAHSIPGLARNLFYSLFIFIWNIYRTRQVSSYIFMYVIPFFKDALELAIGLFFISRPVRIIRWITKWQKKTDRNLAYKYT